MANLSQTAANVAIGDSSTVIEIVQYGEAVTQGQPLYLNNRKWWKADANLSATAAAGTKIALTPGAADGYGVVATSGPVNLGATLAVGETYVVSRTAGAICPIGDLTTGDYVTRLGVASSSSLITLNPEASGVVKP